jgi:manganese/zinc/iron transport system substrate-binding protein
MVTDIVRVVGGDRTNVEGLIGEGIDPHLFTAGRNDVQKLLAADVVFYSGLMLEGRMADDFARVGRKGKPVFPVTESIDREKLREPPEFEGHWDPHVWMDVALWSECVDHIANELGTHDGSSSEAYRARADEYRKQLAELDDYIRKVVSTIPKEQRYLITAHDAFGYFSKSYGIEVKAIQGISTDSQAAISDINSLVDFIVENKVPAIFVESSVSKKNIEAVIEGCGERGWKIRIGAELYSDAMGKPGTYEGSYIGMMDHNATKIARALGGEAPEKGWQGKLAAEH